MIVTLIGMASILLGFICVMAAFWLFHNRDDKRGPIFLGILAIVFLTLIPATCAIFFASTTTG
ncbi:MULTISPECIES: hypothetical protein [unclassified Corynebacterium]|jgi:hypothetical protein|uniref:hypothetical protein n=1 Tax=unclassified Corynebacterium TaxID=2624378 RepID=UPI0003B7FDAC|nr:MULTISPECIES: hypothetical protein [unclassified Corynebacterium]ERS52837.1 hypothetical protein HMPREF1281_01316 [Corynebacterium sp. KPL1855]ERS63510.1 hypothetical protein HMPREF1257_01261 [Corynebacterium sp. KPL1814]ERS79746.1 hypothetical protein HMPREF1285_01153 [Corynebacterium sp. KPL1859]MDK8660113.1 hypothetical protein [Corynebacterium sp. MSK204]